ncbi:hypothetical protein [Gordonia sp. N1V]|uniref:hypothetical protein n=1 Tax=Gordonia sp. N1V TaxID=3034163 RepID=UPI0023E2727E|nr:hypothetical protein [Gordonia sp. N1V]MDF3280456.1 hypothetical protein [Gordonia sp. N1V]
MTWHPITCTEREELIDKVGRSHNGPAAPYAPISGRSDLGGEYGDPCILTIWGRKETEAPLLKDIRYPAPDFDGPDSRPCEHFRWEESR